MTLFPKMQSFLSDDDGDDDERDELISATPNYTPIPQPLEEKNKRRRSCIPRVFFFS